LNLQVDISMTSTKDYKVQFKTKVSKITNLNIHDLFHSIIILHIRTLNHFSLIIYKSR